MEYEIVKMEKKLVAGPFIRTGNNEPDMQPKIGGLWQSLYREGLIEQIPGKKDGPVYGVYTNYSADVSGEYDVIAGCEVERAQTLPEGMKLVEIPAGRYAKFSIMADMQGTGIGELWQQIWATPLNRAYTADFEEYMPVGKAGKAPVNVYIALR